MVAIPCFFITPSALGANRLAQEKAARKACLLGDYERGVSTLSDLFVDTRNPVYIFNQARCYQQNRHYEEAIARFQEYLRIASESESAADRATAQKHIAECQELLDKQSAKRPTTPAPAVAEPAPRPAPPAPVAEPLPPQPPAMVAEQHSPGPVTSSSGFGLHTVGVVVGAVGVAGIITGALLNLKANSMASNLEGLDNYSDSKNSNRRTYETLGWLSYGLGALCGATGAVLYLVGRDSPPSPSMTLFPELGPNQAGAVLRGAF